MISRASVPDYEEWLRPRFLEYLLVCWEQGFGDDLAEWLVTKYAEAKGRATDWEYIDAWLELARRGWRRLLREEDKAAWLVWGAWLVENLDALLPSNDDAPLGVQMFWEQEYSDWLYEQRRA